MQKKWRKKCKCTFLNVCSYLPMYVSLCNMLLNLRLITIELFNSRFITCTCWSVAICSCRWLPWSFHCRWEIEFERFIVSSRSASATCGSRNISTGEKKEHSLPSRQVANFYANNSHTCHFHDVCYVNSCCAFPRVCPVRMHMYIHT